MTTILCEPELPGVQPPRVQTPAAKPAHPHALDTVLREGEPLRCSLAGVLAAPPRLRADPLHGERLGVEYVLHQHVPQHPRCWRVVGIEWFREERSPVRAVAIATAKAGSVLPGQELLLLGVGLEAGEHDGAPALRLMRVLKASRVEGLCSRAPPAPDDAPDLLAPAPAPAPEPTNPTAP